MAKPYSYDLRRKVIDAIELDGMKRCEASEYFRISRNTITYGFSAKLKQAMLKLKSENVPGIVTRSLIGRSFESLPPRTKRAKTS